MPNAVQFYDDGTGDKVLFGDSEGNNTDKVAFHEDCCCGRCDLCIDGGPLRFQVVLSGITDYGCSDCDETFNDTFVLTFHSATSVLCRWRYTFPAVACNRKYLDVALAFSGGRYWLNVNLLQADGGAGDNWQKDLGATKPACKTWSNEDVPYNWSIDIACHMESSTCKVTAL